MLAIRITGNQLRAGRALAHLSMEDLAARARLCRRSIAKWEGSSNAAPDAMVGHLSRVLDVLEAEGIRFSDGGVHLQRTAPISSVIHSEGVAAGQAKCARRHCQGGEVANSRDDNPELKAFRKLGL